ncbi:orotidine 5'-monophosphate decarboxylase [Metarhizium guizhouense ARSEF 977]|uniref:Orotidine 5'-phosphate decarboxylase n=1 Tax=Metarhizium guizhouense (strain ARSEF 977) TaxID=1276136 RepID=A0A0B4GYS6_METGA|nr:orotidine 5'-monophosphate decarboxylase [Metarhizium guizhouense ARSEF 977]
MASKSTVPYSTRAASHPHPVAKKLFRIADSKRSNLIISADFSDTDSLLKCADGKHMCACFVMDLLTRPLRAELGPYIAVFKTHVDIIHDFSDKTVSGLKELAAKHDFLIFEDRKFVDIGTTVQKQYHGGALRIFTTGVNGSESGDGLGQRYQTPAAAIGGGSDFIIAGRGIYSAEDPCPGCKAIPGRGLGGL